MIAAEKHRPKCAIAGEQHTVVYFSVQDAYACVDCDRWLEPKCPDGEHCIFCRSRPEKPSDIESS